MPHFTPTPTAKIPCAYDEPAPAVLIDLVGCTLQQAWGSGEIGNTVTSVNVSLGS